MSALSDEALLEQAKSLSALLFSGEGSDADEDVILFALRKVRDEVTEAAAMREALEGCVGLLTNASVRTGVCCCGDDMEHHGSPMDCGHSPVDSGEYNASLCLDAARTALGETK